MPSYSSRVTLTTASKIFQHSGGRPARRPPTAKAPPDGSDTTQSNGSRARSSFVPLVCALLSALWFASSELVVEATTSAATAAHDSGSAASS